MIPWSTLPTAHALLLLLLVHLLELATLVSSADVRVDDTDSSISYSPVDSWQEGSGCSTCALSPDAGSAFDGSWHDTTYYPDGAGRTITLRFTGVAISAYFIVPDQTHGTASVDTNLVFTLDGSQVGTYVHSPSGGSAFLYNQQAFAKSGLSDGEHTIVVSAASSGGESTSVLFDYFIYTTQDESSTTALVATSSSSSSSGSPMQSSSTSTVPSGTSSLGTATGSPSSSNNGSLSPESSDTASMDEISTFTVSGSIVISTVANTASPSESSSNSLSNSSSQSSSHTDVGAVAGGIAGGVLGLLLILLLLCCCRRRTKQVSAMSLDETAGSPWKSSGTTRRLWFCLDGNTTPEMVPYPATFEEDANSPQTDTTRLFKNGSSRPLVSAAPYTEKHQQGYISFTSGPDSNPNRHASLSTDTHGTDDSLSTTAILSQVAAIQATVLSLQEQRIHGHARTVGWDAVESAIAPPAYSRAT